MLVNGLYSALEYSAYFPESVSDYRQIDDDFNTLVSSNQQDAVVSIVMFPAKYVNFVSGSGYPSKVDTAPKNVSQSVSAPSTIDGYTPRNKKLLTYPYTFLCVDTLNSSKNYRYEFFANRNNIEFNEIGCVSPSPEILVVPKYYNGATSGQYSTVLNPTESVTCAGFPQCAFVIDSYRAWVAQKSTDYNLSQAQNLVRAIGAGSMVIASEGASVGSWTSLVNTALESGRETNAALIEQTAGSKTRGTTGASADVASKAKAIYYKTMSITSQFARMIDDFFDRFGYTCGRIKIPNRNVRPHWTYTKTVDVAIRGNVPVDDMRKIKSIYNNGITFWKYGSEVGNYSLNNSV